MLHDVRKWSCTVAVTKKFTFFIMPLALHGYNVTVHGRAVTVTIKITHISLDRATAMA